MAEGKEGISQYKVGTYRTRYSCEANARCTKVEDQKLSKTEAPRDGTGHKIAKIGCEIIHDASDATRQDSKQKEEKATNSAHNRTSDAGARVTLGIRAENPPHAEAFAAAASTDALFQNYTRRKNRATGILQKYLNRAGERSKRSVAAVIMSIVTVTGTETAGNNVANANPSDQKGGSMLSELIDTAHSSQTVSPLAVGPAQSGEKPVQPNQPPNDDTGRNTADALGRELIWWIQRLAQDRGLDAEQKRRKLTQCYMERIKQAVLEENKERYEQQDSEQQERLRRDREYEDWRQQNFKTVLRARYGDKWSSEGYWARAEILEREYGDEWGRYLAIADELIANYGNRWLEELHKLRNDIPARTTANTESLTPSNQTGFLPTERPAQQNSRQNNR